MMAWALALFAILLVIVLAWQVRTLARALLDLAKSCVLLQKQVTALAEEGVKLSLRVRSQETRLMQAKHGWDSEQPPADAVEAAEATLRALRERGCS